MSSMKEHMYGKYAALIVMAMSLCSWSSLAGPKRTLVIFGDSLSDTGNTLFYTNGSIPASPYYWQGRFTGPPGNWVDYLQRYMLVTPANFAFGASPACAHPDSPLPGLAYQYAMYRAKVAQDPRFRRQMDIGNKTVVIWIGHNDFLDGAAAIAASGPSALLALVRNVSGCVNATLARMLADGEHSVVVGTLGAMDWSPSAVQGGYTAAITPVLGLVNNAIRSVVRAAQAAFPAARVVVWDSYTDSKTVFQNPQTYGFKYYNDTCIVFPPGGGLLAGSRPLSSCTDPTDHLFHDQVHPSTRVHRLTAQKLQAVLAANGFARNVPSRRRMLAA